MFKCVIFDLDGVLIDTEPILYEAKKAYFLKNGIEFTHEELCLFSGSKFYDTLRANFDYISPELKEELIKNYKFKNDFDYEKIKNPYAEQVFKYIKEKGLKIGIASNSPMEKIAAVIAQCGFESYIDYYASGISCEKAKPAPDVYLKVMSHFNYKPEECIAVEDSDYGLMAAQASGAYVVCKKEDRFNFKQEIGDQFINDLNELCTII